MQLMVLTDIGKAEIMIPGPPYPDLFTVHDTPVILPGEAVCLNCGCTDDAACEGGCWWHVVNYGVGIGECSNCIGNFTEIILHWDEIASERRNSSYCHRCGFEKDPLIVRRHGRIIVAIRVCRICW